MHASPEIVPFWQHLRPIATYPFRGAALYSLLALTAFIAIFSMLPGIVGWLMKIVGWVAAFKFAFEVLRTTANGKLDAPEVVLGVDDSVVWRYFALQLFTVAVPAVVGFWLSWALGIALYAVFSLVQPAAIMSLAMTQSLRAALNPGLWMAIIGRIGWPYLALIGLLLVMQLSAANAGGFLSEMLPWLLAEPAALLFSLWALFATFHLMGYMLWQYHESLGIEPKALTDAVGLPPNRDRELLEAASAQVQQGSPAAAVALIGEELKSRAVSVEVHELYRRLLKQTGDSVKLAEHGPLFLHLLLIEKKERPALGLARECLDADPNFVAMQPEDSAFLAERAGFSGQSKLALELLQAVIRRHPRHADMPAWTLRAVDLLLRQPGQEAQARGLIESARTRCTDDALDGKLAALLATLPA